MRGDSPIFLGIFLVVLAPVGAVVLVSAMLLLGMKPHSVFAPGWAVKSFLETRGLHPPNAVGVASTVILWWAVIAALGLVWEWWRWRRAA